MRKEEEVKQVFQYARTEFGGVDVCVNNAGLAHVTPILESTTEELRDMLEVSQWRLYILITRVPKNTYPVRTEHALSYVLTAHGTILALQLLAFCTAYTI